MFQIRRTKPSSPVLNKENTVSSSMNRRTFVQSSLAGTALLATGVHTSSAEKKKDSPNEKLNIAAIGVANKGGHNIGQLKSQNIVALCDVDSNLLGKTAAGFSKAKQFRDYREMLENHHKTFDAVVVSTADHNHAPATAIALSMGKHVYCEKPLTHTVAEARAIAKLAEKQKVATQMGTQIHAGSNYRRVVELIQSGAIGKVKSVYNWCNKGWSNGRFGKTKDVPANLKWDLWLGPAKERPYCDGVHPFHWRRFWEYGSGTFGDMACHIMDLPFWALKLTHPETVEVKGPEPHPVGAPAWTLAHYGFPKTEQHDAIDFYWSDGGKHHDLVKNTKAYNGRSLSTWGLGVLFVGDKGMLAANYGSRELYPKEKFAGFTAPAASIAPSIGHWNEWVKACKEGTPTTCNFTYSGRLTETVLVGIAAFRTGKKLKFDAASIKATNAPEADQYLTKEYRKGWQVAGL